MVVSEMMVMDPTIMDALEGLEIDDISRILCNKKPDSEISLGEHKV